MGFRLTRGLPLNLPLQLLLDVSQPLCLLPLPLHICHALCLHPASYYEIRYSDLESILQRALSAAPPCQFQESLPAAPAFPHPPSPLLPSQQNKTSQNLSARSFKDLLCHSPASLPDAFASPNPPCPLPPSSIQYSLQTPQAYTYSWASTYLLAMPEVTQNMQLTSSTLSSATGMVVSQAPESETRGALTPGLPHSNSSCRSAAGRQLVVQSLCSSKIAADKLDTLEKVQTQQVTES